MVIHWKMERSQQEWQQLKQKDKEKNDIKLRGSIASFSNKRLKNSRDAD